MSFRLTYATMFNPPEAMHERFDAALASVKARLGARHALFIDGADVAPECAPEFAAKYAGRYCFTAKKMGAQTAEANINAGLAAARQIVGFFEKGDTTFKVN